MKVLVCGSRHWANRDAIHRELEGFSDGTVIIHGAAKGVDRLAGEEAIKLGLAVKEFPAEWGKHGKAAGPIRNQQMLDENPDLVLAFTPNLEKSRGTKDMVNRARKKGVRVKVFER